MDMALDTARHALKMLAGLVLTGCAIPTLAAIPYDLAFQMRELRRNDPPAVSPLGDRVAYVIVTPPEMRLQSARFLPNGTPADAIGARIHLSGPVSRLETGLPPICGGRGNQWNPVWSPDGQQLAFYSDEEGRPELWIHEPATGECRQTDAAVIRASSFMGYQPRWSPDGRTIYVPLRPDPPLEVSDTTDPTAIGDKTDSAAPLVFHSGSEPTQDGHSAGSFDLGGFLLSNYNATLAAVDAETGATRTLVDARAEPRPGALKVSPSGQWVSYDSIPASASNVASMVRQLLVVPASGGEPFEVVSDLSPPAGNTIAVDYRWQPGQDRLVYLHKDAVWSVTVDRGGPRPPLQMAKSLGKLIAPILYFTRDGRSLVVGIDLQGKGRDSVAGALAVVPLDGGKPKRLSLPDPDEWKLIDLVLADEDMLWQSDPRYLTVQMRNRSTGHEALFKVDIASGKSHLLDSGLHRLRQFGSGGDHRVLYAVYEDIGTPPDLYRYDADLSHRGRVSVVEPRIEALPPARVEVFENVVPLYDGRLQRVRTTLLLPHGAKAGDKLPAIVMIYSGSDLSTSAAEYGGGTGNTVPNQVFTSRGFAVVMADIRLSDMGEPAHPLQNMTDTLLPQVYALANAGYIDIERLAVSGQSFGGYSTVAITSATNLFRAAIAVNGTFDLGSFYGVMDAQGNSFMTHWAESGQGRMGETPWEGMQRYIANSPYYRVDHIQTPLFLVAGEGDTSVPFEQSKAMFVGLRRMKKPAQLAIYPGEGHVIDQWSIKHATDVSQRMVEFLGKHLGTD